MEIKTERMLLRPLAPKDFPLWRDGYLQRSESKNEFDVGRVDMTKYDRKYFCNYVSYLGRQFLDDRKYVFGLFNPTETLLYGTIELSILIRDAQISWGFIGYSVHNQYWNLGYATEALIALVDFARNNIKLKRLEICVEERNLSSIKVAQKCGFIYECKRENFLFEDNVFKDVLVYYLNLI